MELLDLVIISRHVLRRVHEEVTLLRGIRRHGIMDHREPLRGECRLTRDARRVIRGIADEREVAAAAGPVFRRHPRTVTLHLFIDDPRHRRRGDGVELRAARILIEEQTVVVMEVVRRHGAAARAAFRPRHGQSLAVLHTLPVGGVDTLCGGEAQEHLSP